ncbi:hypothetical protein GN157_13675 [Flavobacterium rakeshii]|uniref:Lipoprotein n=1 Tax=Flavobacterium rakeshii TaxID=1038845 RepID=A0A6N8HGF0_9FLAO|nr:hypothetical protein [Flavobacterium rakeshii]MUV04761.1 hypothetical protein [Flavobacterium rakeshii]
MKRFSLFMVVASLVITGCSTDNDLKFSEKQTSAFNLKAVAFKSLEAEVLGEIINEYVSKYDDDDKELDVVIDRMQFIAKSNSEFVNLQGGDYAVADKGLIEEALNQPEMLLQQNLFTSPATNVIKAFFNNEINEEAQINDVISSLGNEITICGANSTEEELVLKSVSLMVKNRELSLVKDDKDKEWHETRSICASSLTGGFESPAQAVFNAAVVSIMSL